MIAASSRYVSLDEELPRSVAVVYLAIDLVMNRSGAGRGHDPNAKRSGLFCEAFEAKQKAFGIVPRPSAANPLKITAIKRESVTRAR